LRGELALRREPIITRVKERGREFPIAAKRLIGAEEVAFRIAPITLREPRRVRPISPEFALREPRIRIEKAIDVGIERARAPEKIIGFRPIQFQVPRFISRQTERELLKPVTIPIEVTRVRRRIMPPIPTITAPPGIIPTTPKEDEIFLGRRKRRVAAFRRVINPVGDILREVGV